MKNERVRRSVPLESLYPSSLFGGLSLIKLKVGVCFQDGAMLPPFLGSAWRGLIGWELKTLICPFGRRPRCQTCTINEHCPYFILMEKRSTLPGLLNSPRGYIIDSVLSQETNNICNLCITLFGYCERFLPVLIKSLLKGQKTGLGANRSRYEIVSIDQMLPDGKIMPLEFDMEGLPAGHRTISLREWLQRCPEPSGEIRLSTPLRLRKKGKYLSTPDWPFFFASLARRLESLTRIFNGGLPIGKETWRRLETCFSDPGEIQANLRWHDLGRYSNRQKRHVPMGGIVGHVILKNPDPWFLQWWQAASIAHVGKGAAMGLGKIDMA
ncbi:MAG: CRISPR system precrRNA processing endoribonuclease RAMP protein Cas6 [Deltaproteobacteria bacterium]|nr:CRISPR system precrRNA processing endoribonuclease RAMP protein Cas6 [Deltaproteobacteria bacterium]MBW1946789.1 CRISPR system precrRNA processing endoribonuclease RAMP protein Cas6 [Deltaproteobacteria bacterium]